MKKALASLGCTITLLSACAQAPVIEEGPNAGFLAELPENVVAMAAPKQDLTAVKVDQADGCLVYRHRGPVETTLLPLRARDGRPICTRAF